MIIIVPLAGPDFVLSDGSIKGLLDFGQGPLLKDVLYSRPWYSTRYSDTYVFVLHDQRETRGFAKEQLKNWFPDCLTVFLSDYTNGAAYSVLAGVAQVFTNETIPLIVDLADIKYSCNENPLSCFTDKKCGGVLLTFSSDNPAYSYIEKDETGKVLRTAEKEVISTEASAGTYIFRSSSAYLDALSHNISLAEKVMYDGLLYVCPLFNGIIAKGYKVKTIEVRNVQDVKINPAVFELQNQF
ncbi:MAG: hypothetical protein ABF335_01755 [Alphaproteobacteria bacterium]